MKRVRKWNRKTWQMIGWLVLSSIWIGIAATNNPPLNYLDSEEIVSYSELLNKHSWNLLSSPFRVFVITLLIGVGLLILSKERRHIIFLLFLMPCGCSMSFIEAMADYTTFDHIQTVEVQNTPYNLTQGSYVLGGKDSRHTYLILFKCDKDGDTCQRLKLPPYEFEDPKVIVDDSTNQLRVMDGDEVLYSLEAEPK